MLLKLCLALFCFVMAHTADETLPAVRVIRFQIDYPNAKIGDIAHVKKWNSLMRNSVLASLRFINKHWLICGGSELDKKSNDCGKAQVSGEVTGESSYRLNVTFISERDPIRNAKVEATSTVFGVVQIGLKGGIFQYTNALKVLGKPSPDLPFDEAFFCYRGAVLADGDRCRLCPAGTFHAEDSDKCTVCARGAYQEESGRTLCQECPPHRTTAAEGSHSSLQCIPTCPAGYFYDSLTRMCAECGMRGYQPSEGSDRCLPCPEGHLPLYKNSTSIDHCMETCPPGSERSADLQCHLCPLGSFRSHEDPMCMMCPDDRTTAFEGAITLEQCDMPICQVGHYLNVQTGQCDECDFKTYSNTTNTRNCHKCPQGTATYIKGATSIKQCESTDQCRAGTNMCHWLAACYDLPDTGNVPRYSCKCRAGFVGNGYNCTDACEGLCLNNGECVKTGSGLTKCICSAGFLGRRCEKKIFA